jgi:hypothetical protein
MRKRNPIRLKQGYASSSPIPTQVISNEEFIPPPQTFKQAQLEWLIDRASKRLSSKLGIDRREFLKTTGGMALAFLTMNQVFGKFFDVLPVKAAEPQAIQERKGSLPFIFDVQTHYSALHSISLAGKKAYSYCAAAPKKSGHPQPLVLGDISQ